MRTALALIVASLLLPSAAIGEPGTRLKDVASLQGPGSVPLVGYGLVVGLAKTGDRRQTIFSAQTLTNMLERFGLSVPAADIKVENIASAAAAGADTMVAGSAIFGSPDYAATIEAMRFVCAARERAAA